MKRVIAFAFLLAAMPYVAQAQEDPTNKSAGPITSTPPAGTPASAASAPASRAAVKQQARDAMHTGAIPRGQATTASANGDQTPSTASRDAVAKDATKMVHSTQPSYGATTQYMQRNAVKSTADRAEVKQQTKNAESANQLPRGEATAPGAGTSAN